MKNRIQPIKNFSFSGVGVMIEWYDFFLYIALNKFWIAIFFHGYSNTHAQLYILAIYCLSYLGRLVGGSVIASFADRFGRKIMFINSSLLITSCSLLIAFMPINHLPQTTAIVLFSILRFFQGVAVGGETPGAQTLLYENTGPRYKATALAFLNFNSSAGSALALLMVYGMTQVFSDQAIIEYAWRIPYVIATLMGGLIFVIRRCVDETPAFKHIGRQSKRTPFAIVIQQYPLIISVAVFSSLIFEMLNHFMTSGNILLIQRYHFKESQLLHLGAICCLIGACKCMLIGLLIDRTQHVKRCIIAGLVITLAITAPSFYGLHAHTNLAYYFTYFSIDIANNLVCYPTVIWVAQQVSTESRTSALTLVYNGKIFLISLLVMSMTAFINHHPHSNVIPGVIWVSSVIPIIAMTMLFKLMGKSRSIATATADNEQHSSMPIEQAQALKI